MRVRCPLEQAVAERPVTQDGLSRLGRLEEAARLVGGRLSVVEAALAEQQKRQPFAADLPLAQGVSRRAASMTALLRC